MKADNNNELQNLAALQTLGLLDAIEKQTFDVLLREQKAARAALIKFEHTAQY